MNVADLCSVCAGVPFTDRECICGGKGTEQGEIDGLRAEVTRVRDENRRLREAISPGRCRDLEYYISVAARMREREEKISAKPLLCTRDTYHEGPCNGYPRPECRFTECVRKLNG